MRVAVGWLMQGCTKEVVRNRGSVGNRVKWWRNTHLNNDIGLRKNETCVTESEAL